MGIEFPDHFKQRRHRAPVVLKRPNGAILLNRTFEVHSGEPVGDWCNYHDQRIALHDDGVVFSGIVPDSM